jgi:hypothetical protein
MMKVSDCIDGITTTAMIMTATATCGIRDIIAVQKREN